MQGLERLRKILPHAGWGLTVGAAITFTGRGDVAIRSYGLLFVAVWIAVDFWAWLIPAIDYFEKPNRIGFKYCIGAAFTCALGTGLMLIMFWQLRDRLEDDREEVERNLSIIAQMPDNQDIHKIRATMINNGQQDIASHHQILCRVNRMNLQNGSTVTNVGWGASQSPAVIQKHGDGESDACLKGSPDWGENNAVICMDMTVEIDFSLVMQPSILMTKRVRLVASGDKSDFLFYQQPLESTDNFCPLPQFWSDRQKEQQQKLFTLPSR